MPLLNTLKFITKHPLNQDAKFNSIIRYLKWQVGSRLVSGPVVFDWINGSKFLVRNGETGLTGNIYTGLHEFADMSFLLHFLRSEDLFVDIGANAGSYTILACSAKGARGVAFEPVPSTFQRLVENMRLNYLEEKVICINKGVAANSGEITFTNDRDTTNHAIASGELCKNIVNVDVISLDDVLHAENPSLIKVDVEGYEAQVLAGAQESLKKNSLHVVILELNGSGSRYGFDESRILELMQDNGFQTYSYNPLNRMLINLGGKKQDSGNTLFIRDKRFVEERLRNSSMISINGMSF